MKFKKIFFLVILSAIAISCMHNNQNVEVIDFSDTIFANKAGDSVKLEPIYVAIASIVSPKESFGYYNDLIQCISIKLKRPIYLKQKKSYAEVNQLLANSEVSFAFICSGAYITEFENKTIKVISTPIVNGQNNYYAYIITQKNSTINNFENFRNRSFAFTDPLSNTGWLYPHKRELEVNHGQPNFFSQTSFTYGHDIALQLVNHGIVDGASVHSLIFDYIAVHSPEKVDNIKIIEKSEYFGIPPVVAPVTISNELFYEIQNIFLNMHNDSIALGILKNINIEKFVIANDSIYNNVRKLKKYIENEKN